MLRSIRGIQMPEAVEARWVTNGYVLTPKLPSECASSCHGLHPVNRHAVIMLETIKGLKYP